MARAQVYGAQGFYFRGAGDLNTVGANVVDSKTQPTVAVGLAYAYLFTDSDADAETSGHDMRLAFAHAVVPNTLSLAFRAGFR